MSETKEEKTTIQIKTVTIVEAVAKLTKAKYDALDAKEAGVVLRAIRHLQPMADAYTKWESDCMERLGYKELQEKRANFDNLSDSEKLELNKAFIGFNDRFNESVMPEREKLVTLEFERLSEEAFLKFMKGNPDWTLGEAMTLQDVLA